MYLNYENRLRMMCEIVWEEVENGKDKSVIYIVWVFVKLILLGFFFNFGWYLYFVE